MMGLVLAGPLLSSRNRPSPAPGSSLKPSALCRHLLQGGALPLLRFEEASLYFLCPFGSGNQWGVVDLVGGGVTIQLL